MVNRVYTQPKLRQQNRSDVASPFRVVNVQGARADWELRDRAVQARAVAPPCFAAGASARTGRAGRS